MTDTDLTPLAAHLLERLTTLARRAPMGLVTLADLRDSMPGLVADEFEMGLLELRKSYLVQLAPHEGRHGKPTDRERAAQIVEGSGFEARRFIFVRICSR